MKLYYSAASPYVRKVLVTARLCGLDDRIERVPSTVTPIQADPALVPHNPLSKVPSLILDDGTVLYDSRVICEYLDTLGGGMLFGSGAARWAALARQALGDGLLDAALLARYEGWLRPAELRWHAWTEGMMAKIEAALNEMEAHAAMLSSPVNIGTVAVGCALGYLDFRFVTLAWRPARPRLAEWFETFGATPAMAATRPPAS